MPSAKKTFMVVGVPLIAAAAVVLAMLWLNGTFRKNEIHPAVLPTSRPAVDGKVVAVTRVERPLLADVVGSVQAEKRTTISSRLSANIVAMHVSAGDVVKKGDVLVELDDRDLKSRVAQSRETLKAVEAKRDMTRIELDRVEQMVSKNVATTYELDQWKANWATALADVARATQGVTEAEVTLSDTVIRSPIDGVVIDRQAEPGDLASPGTGLMTVYDPSRLRLEASVREAYIGKLHGGQSMGVWIDALNQSRAGTVEQIVPAADPSSRSFLVKVHIEDPTDLFPGMFGRLRLPLGERRDLTVPAAAVRQVGQLSLVMVATADGDERRSVRLGEKLGDDVVVLAGLDEGEKVVVGE